MFKTKEGGKNLENHQLIYKPCIFNQICSKYVGKTEIIYYDNVFNYYCYIDSKV